MEGRIVISFRDPGAPQGGSRRGFLERARALDARARAHGAVMVAWGASSLSFAFDAAELADAIDLVTTRGDDTVEGESAWCVGLAEGNLTRYAEDRSHGDLAWGPPLVAASVLCGAARPGEILCAHTVRALRSGDLLSTGTRIGRDGALRVRGARLDPRLPWRWQAVEQLAHMRVAPLVGAAPSPDSIVPGSLLVVRADPGAGGTRYITELAARATRALVVGPSGSGLEPLGALRHALDQSVARELSPPLLELAGPLKSLLAGDGVSLDIAARLVMAVLCPTTEGEAAGLLLLDDAKSVDPATLEACVRASQGAGTAAFGIVARLDATSGLPSVLAALTRTSEIEIAPLSRDAAETLAGGCTSDALDDAARQRWARLGADVPLGIVESVAYGVVSGELRWSDELASPRSRASGRGRARGAADWIRLRARDETSACRAVLGLVALLGGEAKVTRLGKVLERAGERVDTAAVLAELIRGRWLVGTQGDWVRLPSRTHREALAGLLDAGGRGPLHRAAAEVIEEEEGLFGRVEAAWHAAEVGDGPAAARVLLAAARGTAGARLEASTTQLIAFARRADPSCEDAALALLADALEQPPSALRPTEGSAALPRSVPLPRRPPMIRPTVPGPPRAVAVDRLGPLAVDKTRDSEPPTIARVGPASMAQHGVSLEVVVTYVDDADAADSPQALTSLGASVEARLGELAKEALLSSDKVALERWAAGLRAAGESPVLAERLRALSLLSRGDVGDALRVLRHARAALNPADPRVRCQTSLAFGVALSVAGRPQEALLEGMDALARARQAGDEQGAQACVAFLAKLYASVGRAEADRLRGIAAP